MISEFQFLSLLGKGKFGSVFKAKYCPISKDKWNADSQDEFYAIKTLLIKDILKSGFTTQLKNEIEIQVRLSHPNIVELFLYFYDEKFCYLVMECSTIGNLYDYLKPRIFTEKEIKCYIKQLLTAVAYLHELNIVHRDIKLENVLVFEKNRIKLTDFSWAIKCPKRNLTTLCGTPEYLAPELVSKQKYGKEVDVWSIGIISYELLHKETPFYSSSEKEIMANILYKELKFGFDSSFKQMKCSKSFRNFVSSCLQKSPDLRPTAAEMLKHKWLLDA